MDAKIGLVELGSRYDEALLFASRAHRGQIRKNGRVPYFSHPLRVSGLVLDYGGSEDAGIAALLHDVVEDCGGLAALEEIRAAFGDKVASIVCETSDSFSAPGEEKAPWRERKESFLTRLRDASDEGILVSGCDKLDNTTSLIRALVGFGDRTILSKFRVGREEEFWYWESVVSILRTRQSPVAEELARATALVREFWT